MRKINVIFRQYLESSTYADPSLPIPVTGFVLLCCFVGAPTTSQTPHHPPRAITMREDAWDPPAVPRAVPGSLPAGCKGLVLPLGICIFPAFIFLPISVLLQLQTL